VLVLVELKNIPQHIPVFEPSTNGVHLFEHKLQVVTTVALPKKLGRTQKQKRNHENSL